MNPVAVPGDTGVEHVGRSPLGVGRMPVDPSQPPRVVDPEGLSPEDPSHADFLWEEGTITDLSLTIDRDALSTLDRDPDAEVQAILGYGDQTWTVGVQLKGNMTLRGFSGKPSLKLDVHQFAPDQSFFGLRRLTLNNMVQDKSMMKEHLAYHLYGALAVPAPRHGYVRLTVNGAPYGLYGLVESMDEQFINREWDRDDEGNLYEGGYGADLRPGNEDMFAVQEAGTPAPPADLEHIIPLLNDASPEEYPGVLATRFDFDSLMKALAIDLAVGNWDGYARAANNFLLYHAPEANRWSLIPWGQDQAFTDRNVQFRSGWNGRLLNLCGRSTECVDLLREAGRQVIDVWEAIDLAGYAEEVAAAIGPDCESDTRAEIPCSPDDVLRFVTERPATVRAELGE